MKTFNFLLIFTLFLLGCNPPQSGEQVFKSSNLELRQLNSSKEAVGSSEGSFFLISGNYTSSSRMEITTRVIAKVGNRYRDTMRQSIKKCLNVPKNWDKHDYKTLRYSFEDIENVISWLEENGKINIVKETKSPEIEIVSGQEYADCPNFCFKGNVKVMDPEVALFHMGECPYCKGSGEVYRDDYKTIDGEI